MREYERWTTACVNAYVQPVVDRYLDRLESGLAAIGFGGRFLIMNSSGGTLTSAMARRFPVRLLESGPAAGALMSASHGRRLGLEEVLSFDMGGTTAKGCIIQDGAPLKRYDLEVARVHEFKQGSGLPVKIPVLDMIEIGAGGGSIASIDERGLIRVGPQSAGAKPGPASYGRGGTRPTLTDANLVLGYLGAKSFLGGAMELDPDTAARAIEATIAEPLGLDLMHAAWGIHEVINEDVARAFRVHASERGVDYRRCSIVVFGGSGPLHGARIARKLRVPNVVCPVGAGVMSAFGLLVSPIGFEIVRSRRVALAGMTDDVFGAEIGSLRREVLKLLAAAGTEPDGILTRFKLDMRYEGQGYEIEVAVPEDFSRSGDLVVEFEAQYQRVFGLAFPGRAIEIVNWKVEASAPPPGDTRYRLSGVGARTALKGERPVWMGSEVRPCPVYDRYGLAAGAVVEGPALIEEAESTCVIHAGDRLTVDGDLNLVIEIGGI
jgi:N-methylhydantoinase A